MEKIIFCGKECEVIERYELSDEYMEENGLHFKKRIRFIVLFEDGTTQSVMAYDTSEAWELALDLENDGKILDVFIP